MEIDAAERPTFEVWTFVKDESLYGQMRESLRRAGFDDSSFVRLSDRDTDPFAAIPDVASSAARYVILCHQDVLSDHGIGTRELLASLAELDALDPGWVVAGNAGVTPRMRLVARLRDPYGHSTAADLPVPVQSLDENFLVFNRRNQPRTSAGLKGFHMYGTDVCLNALADGGSAYVIDFPLTHLSRGEPDEAFERAKESFMEAWNARCLFRYISTPQEPLFLSRSSILRRIFGSSRALSWVSQERGVRT